MEPKSIWKSKIFWVNLISLAALGLQGLAGKEIIPAELQITLLSVVNILLRRVTGQPVQWLIIALIAPALLLTSCSGMPKRADTPYGEISYGSRHGERVVRNDAGAPIIIDGEVFRESAPGYSLEIWLLDSGADNDPWGDTMSNISQVGMTAVLSAVDPWAAVAALGLNLFGSNPTAAAFVDFVVPEDVRADRWRLDITGQPVAAGWKTKGSDAKDSDKAGGWGDLEIEGVCGWVIFDSALLEKMSDETLRLITNCGEEDQEEAEPTE